ncbi:MAG: hypothetical protein ACFFBI_01795 [Promethearchaeota archaeon]
MTNFKKKNKKPIFKEFFCPQCGEMRHINVNGICFDCNNEMTLDTLAKRRKLQQKFNNIFLPLKVENYT